MPNSQSRGRGRGRSRSKAPRNPSVTGFDNPKRTYSRSLPRKPKVSKSDSIDS
jgi:hypothetical protein